MSITRARRRAALGVVVAFAVAGALAACGTTVPKSQRQASLATGGGELGTPTGYVGAPGTTAASAAAGPVAPVASLDTGTEAVPVTGGEVAPVVPATTSTAPTAVTVTGTKAAHTSSPASTTASSAAATAGALPAGPIKIGYGYVDAGASNAVLAGIGKGLTSADLHAEMDAYVADVNAHGGVLGHPLKLVEYKASTTDSLQAIGQGVCTAETQDDHVVVSLDGNYGGVVFPCMAKAGVVSIYAGTDGLTDADYAADPLVLEPDSISLDRLATLEATQFAAAGYKPTAPQKLGVLYYDSTDFTQGFQALKAAWATQGVQVADSISLHNYNSVSDIAGLEASVQGAELKFRAEGITHVMCVETNAFICGFFGLYASSQGYFPRYAFTSDQPMTNILANVPAKELTGALFLGWSPPQDLSTVASMTPGVQSCFTFMNQHGFATDDGNERDGAAGICEAIDYTVAAIKAGGSTTAAGILAGAKKLGTSYASRRVLGVGPRPDGVDEVRMGAFEPSCSCFTYTGAPVAAS